MFLQCRTCFYVWSVDTAEPDRPAPAAVGGTRRGDAGAGPKRDVTGDAAAARSGGSDDGEWDDAVIAKVWLGDCARDVVTSRGGDLIYVMTADSVKAINSFHHIVASIPIGPEPKHMMMSSGGSRIYVTGYDGSLSIIDPIEMTAKTFGVQRRSAAVVSPEGEYIYLAHGEGWCDGSSTWILGHPRRRRLGCSHRGRTLHHRDGSRPGRSLVVCRVRWPSL